MAADYAGALAAIKAKFIAEWTGTAADTVGFVNEPPPRTVDADGVPSTWVLLELLHAGSAKLGVGTPGASVTVYDGLIKAHIFVPSGSGIETCHALSLAAGEIFRNQLFYDSVTAGCFVRSGYERNGQPRIEQGEAESEDGNWFAITATIPFEFWCRK